MNAQTVGWFVFLALIKKFYCAQPIYFKLQDSHLTATEGSCIEIKCRVTRDIDAGGAYWFWMKNPIWNDGNKTYSGTVIHSTDNTKRPVSPDFAGRVTYIGSLSSSWKHAYSQMPPCSILICDLNKADSGNYIFRFFGEIQKWATAEVNLTVTENPCLITFEKPPVLKENDRIILTCSTSSLCPSNPQIEDSTEVLSRQPRQGDEKQKKSTRVSLTVNWKDDGRTFSCQTQDNKDKHLIRNISLNVEYAPKETWVKISPQDVKEGQPVTLTCSANGRPVPTYTWIDNEQQRHSGAEWTFIDDSQNREYRCKANNKHGEIRSNPVIITYVPRVDIAMTPPASVVKQGDKRTLTCNLKRSSRQHHTYAWFLNQTVIGGEQTYQYVIKSVKPEDRGFYKCSATNTAGTGTSGPLQITVEYSPRKTIISTSETRVKVGHSLTFTCNTDANPAPTRYSWYRDSANEQWKSKTTNENSLRLDGVQRADEACYTCNATNSINTGENSKPVCIQVLYRPTNLTLSMDTDVREGQRITISCTVDSFPPSKLILERTSASNPRFSEWHLAQSDYSRPNALHHTFNVTSAHAGFYTCNATNSEDSKKSNQRKLVVKYRPKNVTIRAEPGLVVNEGMSLTLHCRAQSHPKVTSVTWMKETDDGKSETIGQTETFSVKSVGPSDSGPYGCTASNEIGAGSHRAWVKVKYAPKHTEITRAAEQQLPDGTSYVTLSCSSHSYPSEIQYSWYKKIKAGESDVKVSDLQNYTVSSEQPGVYYCIAKNEINQRASDPIQLYDRSFTKVLMSLLLCLCLILLVICLIVFVCRHKRNKSIQPGTPNTLPCFGSLGWWTGARRGNLMNEPVMAEPFRSRDDLSDQPCRPHAQRRQPRPDSTPASNINTVYCTVNLPAGKRGPPAQIRQQAGHTVDDYASLHFKNTQKNKQAKAEAAVVYAVVSKKNKQERLEDYENVGRAQAARSPGPPNHDTDTSEDEVELNYSQVNFAAKPGRQRAGGDSSSDSSTSDGEETQYSDVKI